MKYKVGDRVKIKNLDWYNKNKDRIDEVVCGNTIFVPQMVEYCEQVVTISSVLSTLKVYRIKEDGGMFNWTDDMIEGLAEEETKPDKVIEEAKTYWDSIKDAWICPDGYQFKDENGNIINATKIVLEKKIKYPKTYEECCEIFQYNKNLKVYPPFNVDIPNYDALHLFDLLEALRKLLICRDAYWKLYGEEMGLRESWSPDWTIESSKYIILFKETKIEKHITCKYSRILAFPTEEMRDAFYENFKKEIEICKELL